MYFIISSNPKIIRYEKECGEIDVSLIRGESRKTLEPFFKSDQFDLIFVDGAHSYKECLDDLTLAKRIVKKDFSIICGDDLEQLPTEERIKIAKTNMKTDSTVTSADGDAFHPGVLLAVAESFNEVNMSDSFWWVYCVNGAFTTNNPHS